MLIYHPFHILFALKKSNFFLKLTRAFLLKVKIGKSSREYQKKSFEKSWKCVPNISQLHLLYVQVCIVCKDHKSPENGQYQASVEAFQSASHHLSLFGSSLRLVWVQCLLVLDPTRVFQGKIDFNHKERKSQLLLGDSLITMFSFLMELTLFLPR